MEGEEKELMTQACSPARVLMSLRGKSRSWEEKKTKVPDLQIYVQNVKVVALTV